MTSSYTITSSFTKTHADYLASKIAADLRQMRLYYGVPTEAKIEDLLLELSVLLQEGCIERIEYGLRRNGQWIVVLKYDASNGLYLTDDRAGRVPAGVDVAGASFYSYLTTNSKWADLPQSERDRISRRHNVERGDAPPTPTAAGYWTSDKTYSNGGVSLARSVFRPI
jgi:hypothetical protein